MPGCCAAPRCRWPPCSARCRSGSASTPTTLAHARLRAAVKARGTLTRRGAVPQSREVLWQPQTNREGARPAPRASKEARKVPAQPRRGRHPARLGNAPGPARGQRVPAQPQRRRHPAQLGDAPGPVRRQAAARPTPQLAGSKAGRRLPLRALRRSPSTGVPQSRRGHSVRWRALLRWDSRPEPRSSGRAVRVC
jgi:hypothetical protein